MAFDGFFSVVFKDFLKTGCIRLVMWHSASKQFPAKLGLRPFVLSRRRQQHRWKGGTAATSTSSSPVSFSAPFSQHERICKDKRDLIDFMIQYKIFLLHTM